MKRILLLIDEMESGGAERQFAYLAVGLKRAGCEVRFVKFYEGENFYGADTDAAGIITECMPEGKNGLKRALLISRLVKAWKPDLTICYKNGTCMAACIARIFTKFNLVVSERNTTQKLTRNEKRKFLLYRYADHIVPNSYSQADFITRYFPNLKSKMAVITNMIDTQRFSPADEPPRNTPPRVVTIARVMPQKNVLEYLAAIKILKDRGIKVHFDWYGKQEGIPEYWQTVCHQIEELGLKEMVSFHKPTKDTVSVYRSADVFLLPSVYEGFPNVLCEAMACGLPSIATAVCDSPRILTDSRWQADPASAQDIANRIEQMLLLCADELSEIGKENRKRILSLCSGDIFITRYLSLI